MYERRVELLREYDEVVPDRLNRIQEQLDKVTDFVQGNRSAMRNVLHRGTIAKLQTKSAIFAAIAGIIGGVLSSLGFNNFSGK